MKKVLTIVLAMLCLASCEKSTQKNDLAELKLNGKVKSIREIPYKAVEKFGEVVKGDALGFEQILQITFNEKGNKIESNSFNSDGSLSFKSTYKYDDKGNKIELNYFNSDGSLFLKSTSKYDDKGNKIELNGFNPDGRLSSKSTYKYDDKDNLIEVNSDSDSKFTYKYDDKGNKIEQNWFTTDGSLFSKWTYKYTYDQQDNWTQKIIYDEEKPIRIVERTIEYY